MQKQNEKITIMKDDYTNEVDDDKIERDGRYRSQKRSVLHK